MTMEGEVKAIQVREGSSVISPASTVCGLLAGRRYKLSILLPSLERLTRPHIRLQKDAETKMKKSVDSVDNNLKAIRTGRAS